MRLEEERGGAVFLGEDYIFWERLILILESYFILFYVKEESKIYHFSVGGQVIKLLAHFYQPDLVNAIQPINFMLP